MVILTNFTLCGLVLQSLNLTIIERTCLLFAGIALGYAGSGRVAAMFVFALTKWPLSRCMIIGTWLAYLLGAVIAVGLGHLLAR